MKKIIAALMCAALMITLTACSSGDSGEVNVTAEQEEPQAVEAPVENEQPENITEEMPVLADAAPAINDIPPSQYSYIPFTLENSGFNMEVPSHWERRPASKSIYFLEPVEEGQIPARIVVTSKKVSKVRENTRTNQLRSYFTNILGDFDTYEWSEVQTGVPFMGDKNAIWVTYTGTRDGLSYKGYVILGASDTTIFVFHFRCAEEEYYTFENVINRVRDSISFN